MFRKPEVWLLYCVKQRRHGDPYGGQLHKTLFRNILNVCLFLSKVSDYVLLVFFKHMLLILGLFKHESCLFVCGVLFLSQVIRKSLFLTE